ncbi:MAG: hypothetical protein FJ284_03185 [Planctomycetes bacterium]|nr:hypothetical protein [Planctomycetota bacterium]
MLLSLRSSRCVACLALAAWAGSGHASGISVRVTEVMSSSGTGGTPDWFEITNYGSAAVDITGWRMDDNPPTFGAAAPLTPYTTGSTPAWTLLEPGESVVMIESAAPATLVPTFQTFWNLGTAAGNVRNPKIGTYTGSGVSFSSGGDGVTVFDSAGTIVVPQVTFAAATMGSTFYWSYDAAGQLATVTAGTLSTLGIANAFSSGSPTNVGSPGIAVVAAPAVNRFWSASGTALGGVGSWTSGAATWSAAASPMTATAWADNAAAVFGGTAGTVTVDAAVRPLSVVFVTGGYTLASGSGTISTSSVDVAAGQSAKIDARLTGAGGLTLLGGGTLVLGSTANDYAGVTSVGAGTLRVGAAEVIPNGSRLSVARYAAADLSGHAETVAGLAGLGSVTIGNTLTVNVGGTADVTLDGTLRGSGDLVIDSAGSGVQRLDASTQTIADGAVKNYTGATIVRRGTLRVDFNGIPTGTSGVDVEAAGRLTLGADTQGFEFTFGGTSSLPIDLHGGTLGQAAGDDVTLFNAVNVTADSTFALANSTTPDPANPTIEDLVLAGPLIGTAGRTITVAASNTTPGADSGRATFSSGSGNTFTGTVKPHINAVARFTGAYPGVGVLLDQGRLDGSGRVAAVSGTGTIAAANDFGPTVLTATSVTASATTGFLFEFTAANAEPTWAAPTASGNAVLRLTGATPLPSPLGGGNTVRLFLNVPSLAATDTFTGGFFTTGNATAAIAGADYETYVYGNGAGTDFTHNGVGWYSLLTYNAQQGTALAANVGMVATTASFDGVTSTSGYTMRASYAPSTSLVIDVPSGSQTQAQAGHPQILVSDSVTKTGLGTLVLDAANTYTGPTTVSAGTVRVARADAVATSAVTVTGGATLAAATGVVMKSPSVTLDGGTLAAATVAVDASTGIRTLAINSGSVAAPAAVIVGQGGLVDLPTATRVGLGVTSLAVDQTAGGGLVDLGAGQITIAAGGITAADLRADIIAGRNGGSWSGVAGITSSAAAAAAAGTRAVGYHVAGDGSLRISFAAPGDANLDGLVNTLDLVAISASGKFGQNLPASWAEGDFNYDSVTNTLDLVAISGTGLFGQTTSYWPAVVAAAVPEPGTSLPLVVAGIVALALLGSRSQYTPPTWSLPASSSVLAKPGGDS